MRLLQLEPRQPSLGPLSDRHGGSFERRFAARPGEPHNYQ
jgi:hypothetical protein